jgi:hypothetical protein
MQGLREEHQRLKDRLREKVDAAYQRHLAGEGDPEDFSRSLKRLNDFLIDGILPLELRNQDLLSEMKRCQKQYNSDKNNAVFAAAFIQALKNLSDHLRGK